MERILRIDYKGACYEVYYCKDKSSYPYVIYLVEGGNRFLVEEYEYFMTCFNYMFGVIQQLELGER